MFLREHMDFRAEGQNSEQHTEVVILNAETYQQKACLHDVPINRKSSFGFELKINQFFRNK